MKVTLGILYITTILSSCTTTTYYVVRHAEKADNSKDPSLSVAGNLRAITLKDSLISKNIKKIYVTNFQRTQQTAAPLSQAIGVKSVILPASSTTSFIDSLHGVRSHQNILVVGHSNTVSIVIDSLMKSPQHISIEENDFDNFYIVSVKRGVSAKRKLIKSNYGMKSP